jgi:hypothetical protein
MYLRLVHLPNEQKRKELMIIYGEDITPSGFTVLSPVAEVPNQIEGMERRSK